MILEARAISCFSYTYVLKLKDRPIGKLEGQLFSENLDVYLTERRHLEFRKISWLGSQFELVDLAGQGVIGDGERSGVFTTSWDLSVSTGRGQLVKPRFFGTAYEFIQKDEVLARVDRLGWCERGWDVDGADILEKEDLILIGLVYHVIQHRRQQQHSGA